MSNEPNATLVVELGSVTTRATLVDSVAGEARLIGQAEVPSSTEPPYEDATIAILEAAAQIAEASGRQLIRDGALLMPRTIERDGVDAVVATTSAAGQMAMVIAAVSSDISARSALRASRAIYTSVLQTVTLNDTDPEHAQDISWIERQVQRLLGLHPDAVLLAGGLEEGAEDALVRLAHIVGLTTFASGAEGDSFARQGGPLPVVFAGNTKGRERVIEALSRNTGLRVVDNLRPSLEVERLEAARRALTQLYDERILTQLPGMANLRRLCASPVRTVVETTGLMTRFLSERHKRDILTIDVGAASTAIYISSQGRYSPVVVGGIGTGYSAGTLLAERGPNAIARWLPFRIAEQELVHRILNKMLRPHLPPSSHEDLLIEHALAREALHMALAALRDERANAAYDMVVIGGGVLSHAPHPGYAALTVLDALQPGDHNSTRAVDLHLDTLALMAACGALAFVDPDAALTLFDRDMLTNTPLATCVATLGSGRSGETAVEAELELVGGGKQRISVQHGQIGRIPLPIGQHGRLVLRPANGVRIGRNAPGAEAGSGVAEIRGSALGVIIDARGRPLRLPDNARERQQAVWDWLVALGAESGPLPYASREPRPAAVVEPVSEIVPAPSMKNGSDTQEAPVAPVAPPPPSEAPPPDAPALDNDLAKLRQTVENPPKKRGFFRRG